MIVLGEGSRRVAIGCLLDIIGSASLVLAVPAAASPGISEDCIAISVDRTYIRDGTPHVVVRVTNNCGVKVGVIGLNCAWLFSGKAQKTQGTAIQNVRPGEHAWETLSASGVDKFDDVICRIDYAY